MYFAGFVEIDRGREEQQRLCGLGANKQLSNCIRDSRHQSGTSDGSVICRQEASPKPGLPFLHQLRLVLERPSSWVRHPVLSRNDFHESQPQTSPKAQTMHTRRARRLRLILVKRRLKLETVGRLSLLQRESTFAPWP